jgi:hypothetical protein
MFNHQTFGKTSQSIFVYDGGEDLPSEILKPGYIKNPDVGPGDWVSITCGDGAVHMLAVVKSVAPVALGLLARHPNGLAAGRKTKA